MNFLLKLLYILPGIGEEIILKIYQITNQTGVHL